MGTDPLTPPTTDSDLTVAVTGAETELGRSVIAQLYDRLGSESVLPLDSPAASSAVLAESDILVHLSSVFGGEEEILDPEADVSRWRDLLATASDSRVSHVVLLSSATVYGAWSNNPLPLAESATLRPRPELPFATQRAEMERMLAEFLGENQQVTATVLRPAPLVGIEDEAGWLARALHGARRVGDIDGDSPAQFLHVEDLASAVSLAVSQRLKGARNVAPDGWMRGAEYTALDAGTPKLRLPRQIGDALVRLRGKFNQSVANDIVGYARFPWVVANDRLRADGWEPQFSNDEAFVVGTPANPLATLSPRRRQELALGVSGAAIVGGAVALSWAAIRRSRR